MSQNWQPWIKFCKETKREAHINKLIINLLHENKLLPTNKLLDVGCGSGEFIKELKNYSKNVVGIDNQDNRTYFDFDFKKTNFEDYKGSIPNLLIFKQSWHLINDPIKIIESYKTSRIVLIQMLKPNWAFDEKWNEYPYNSDKNKSLLSQKRKITSYKAGLDIKIDPALLEEMFLTGFTSDLQELSFQQRKEIYKNYKKIYNGIFKETLQIIIASPETRKVKKHKII